MKKPVVAPKLKWRRSAELRGYRSQLTAALNACDDGASVTLDVRTARVLREIVDQAIHTEEGHEQPYEMRYS